MIALVAIIWSAVFAVGISQVPDDCFVILGGTRNQTYCYTFRNTTPTSFLDAQSACESRKGKLPVISNVTVWSLLKQQFLQDFKYVGQEYVWMGVSVNANGHTIPPEIDLKFETWYAGLSAANYPNQCLVTYSPPWHVYGIACTGNGYYFCQYAEEMLCNIKDFGDENAVIESLCSDGIDIPYGKTVAVACKPGYYLNTSSTITCHWGKWDDVQCIPGCPPPGKRTDAQLVSLKTGNYDVGDRVTYVCNSEYYSWSDYRMMYFILTCQIDNKWSDDGLAGCGSKREFSVTTIDVASLKNSHIELECDIHHTVNTAWFRNGEVIIQSSRFNITSGNLILQIKDVDVDGLYTCAEMEPGLRLGPNAYKLVRNTNCQSERKTDINVLEDVPLLLSCPQLYEDNSVKWFKDGEEIFSNKYHNIIQRTGLYFRNINLHNGGLYKCVTLYANKESHANCKQIVLYDVSVTAPADKICGTSSNFHQPWLAALYHDDENIPFCYGTLLNSRWVITSAFCLLPLQRKKIIRGVTVQLGTADKPKIFSVASVELHPRYRQRSTQNDIGLLQLHGSPVQFTSNILPACITSDDIGNVHKCESVGGLKGHVSGRRSLVGRLDDNVLEVEHLSLDSKESCRQSKTTGFAEDKFCAKLNGSEENFVGDNGSPFLINYNGKNYVLGVYTWGDRAIGTGQYDYFTSISQHYAWIKSIIG